MHKMTWEYFSNQELACHGTGECDMNFSFMKKLVDIRKELNRPIILNSAYRHPAHNSAIGGVKDSPHIYGRAVDIQCMGLIAYCIVRLAIKHGMTGIGVSQRGNHEQRFIHIDDMTDETHPRPWIWSYK